MMSSMTSSMMDTQSAGTRFFGQCALGDGLECVVGERQLAVLHFEQALVLLDQRILRLGQSTRTSACFVQRRQRTR